VTSKCTAIARSGLARAGPGWTGLEQARPGLNELESDY
jgi:hypothetical protein